VSCALSRCQLSVGHHPQ